MLRHRGGAIRRNVVAFSENCSAASGLLVVSILVANAGADQTNGAKRIELYGMSKIRTFGDGLTNLGGSLRRRRLEIVWISHIGSQAFSNEFPIYGFAVIAEVFRLE